MARPNLLKIDDLLLRAGAMLGLAWLLGSAVGIALELNTSGVGAGTISLVLAAALAPIGLMVAGFRLRGREHRAWALHRLVDDHVEIPASELLRDSDFTAASLERAIRDLNNAGVAFIVWDRDADVVQDGRLRTTRVEVEDCGSCGAKVSLTLRLGDLSSARCPYCHDPLAMELLSEEKARLIDELDTDPVAASHRLRGASGFSLWIFLVLTFVFWPAGVAYALWHWRALQATDREA